VGKPLSEQLAELSTRAKQAEDTFAAAQRERREEMETRKAKAYAAATAAVAKVDAEARSFGDSVSADRSAAHAKIAADMAALKARVAGVKHKVDAKVAEVRAEDLEADASFAIDLAIASVEQANLAVLDAIEGRREAQESA
jgi:hypothetical protein